MKVYLLQHAEAKSKEADPDRPLTAQGREDAERAAALARKLGVTVHQIWHSGKTRAEETATIMGQAIDPADGVKFVEGLGPVDDVKPVSEDLTRISQPVMLVGHLPFMERLASQLLILDPERPIVQFHNAGIVCLEREEGCWQISWILKPEMADV
jgi:phosphohistidine phosphatase